MLPWGCQVQMTGEEGDMTAQSPPPLLSDKHTHTHTTTTEKRLQWFLYCFGFRWPQLWKCSAGMEEGGKAKHNREKMRRKIEGCMETNIYRALTLFQIKASVGKSWAVGAEISQRWQEVNKRCPVASSHTLFLTMQNSDRRERAARRANHLFAVVNNKK